MYRLNSQLWRHRDFVSLWAGQTVSNIGSAVTFLALPLTAVVSLRASAFQVGLLSSAVTGAWLLVALPAGIVADRLPKRTLMLVCDAARMILIGSVPLAALVHMLTLGQLYLVAFMTGAATVLFSISYQSYLPALVNREHLVEANGKLQISQEMADLVGPGLGGGLVGLLSAAGAIVLDGFSYAVSAASLLLIRTRELPNLTTKRDLSHTEGLSELTTGLSFVFREPVLRRTAEYCATFNLCACMSVSLELIFLVRILHVGPAYTGLVLAASALGGVIASVTSRSLSRLFGSVRIICISALGFAPVWLLIPLARSGWGILLFIVGSAGRSFSIVLFTIAQVSYRQAICPRMLLGRMNAAMRWIMWGTIPFGGLLAGVLGSAIGIRATLWISAAVAWGAGLLLFFSPLRAMRDLPESGVDDLHVASTVDQSRVKV
ncbi:MAG TPA: MFS transporter [Gemmataceae bacterium]|nr:MFS transporter [Gemmataceae bacterium]